MKIAEPRTRQAKVLLVAPEAFVYMLTRTEPYTFRVTDDALPEDVRVTRCWIDERTGAISIRLESETFPDVHESMMLPNIEPSIDFFRQEATDDPSQ